MQSPRAEDPEIGLLSTSPGSQTLADTFPTDPESAADPSVLERGVQLGRYVVLHELGRGAMGVVLAAYDPELDRKVALKLLSPALGHEPTAQARMRREAQTLARLAHPNVVGVYDVGVHSERLYLAMEFIAGKTLRSWALEAEQPRPWSELVEVFCAAGSGLAAAHRESILHRDFKPDNVMIDEQGRVRVLDFGLARHEPGKQARAPTLDEPELAAAASSSATQLNATLTQTGSLMGTPAYMAPELLRAGASTPASDQFAFCVALYECLYGERPFPSSSWRAFRAALAKGEVAPAPAGTRVPAWIRAILLRGLAVDPRARWPSLEALLDALAHDPSVRRRRWLAGAGVLGLAGLASWGLAAQLWGAGPEAAPAPPPDPCAHDGGLAELWSAPRRAELEAGLLATGLSYAPETWTRLDQEIGRFTRRWSGLRREACEAYQVGARSDSLYDRQLRCLERRREGVEAFVGALEEIEAGQVQRAVQVLDGLTRLDACRDLDALASALPLPSDPALVAEIERAERARRVIEVRAKMAPDDELLAHASTLVERADELDYGPLRAWARLSYGYLQHEKADYEGARASLEQAYAIGLRARAIEPAAEAATQLVLLADEALGQPELAARWAFHAEPLACTPAPSQQCGTLHNHLSAAAMRQGELERAEAELERSLEQTTRALGPHHSSLSSNFELMGIFATMREDFDAAEAYYQRALELERESLGPKHPNIAGTLANLGLLAFRRGDLERAWELERSALELSEDILGPEHPELGPTLVNLGALALERELPRESHAYMTRALAIKEQALGPEHPSVAFALVGLARAELALGEPARALPLFERAIELRSTQGTPSDLAMARHGRAMALDELGERQRALKLARAAADALRASGGGNMLDEIEAWIAERAPR